MNKDQINSLLNNNGIATYRSGVTCAVFIDYHTVIANGDLNRVAELLADNGLTENENTKAIS